MGAEAGRSTSQEETNPAGHRGRGRCGYAQRKRRASEGDSKARGESRAQRAFGKVRDSGFAERTCLRGVSNESLLSWDKSYLLRGPWEDSLEERRNPGVRDGVLFSPERKEGSGGLERGRWSEDEDLFSPVRLKIGRRTANDRGSENSGKRCQVQRKGQSQERRRETEPGRVGGRLSGSPRDQQRG